MTARPGYIVHEVNERDVTVDWFFARGPGRHRGRQLVLMLIGWFFTILPIVITASALIHRNDGRGWWNYREGYVMWDVTTRTLEFLIAVFIVGFFALYLINRAQARRRDKRLTYDAERLERRLALAADMYAGKYGDEAFRVRRKAIAIEPYDDVETYELRDRYHEYGVD